mgnify:CR=1 FL=1
MKHVNKKNSQCGASNIFFSVFWSIGVDSISVNDFIIGKSQLAVNTRKVDQNINCTHYNFPEVIILEIAGTPKKYLER